MKTTLSYFTRSLLVLTAIGAFAVPAARADQPAMQRARELANQAHEVLKNNATEDKGGHAWYAAVYPFKQWARCRFYKSRSVAAMFTDPFPSEELLVFFEDMSINLRGGFNAARNAPTQERIDRNQVITNRRS